MNHGWRFAAFLPVPVITLFAMWWDRMVHDVANSPEPWERVLADVAWYGSLLALAAAPVLVALRWKSDARPHSAIGDLMLGVAPSLYLMGVLAWGWPIWYIDDLVLVGSIYLLSGVAFSRALYEAIRSSRTPARWRAWGSGGVALVCFAVAAMSSYLLVFFE